VEKSPSAWKRHAPGVRVLVAAAIAFAVVAAALPALRSVPALGATAACTADPSWPAPNASLAQQVIALVNQHRATLGLGALTVDTTLSDSAVWKAQHMAEYDYFGHDDPAPPVARDAYTRALQCGYTSNAAWGENIAEGYPTAAAVMAGWLASPGHKMNIEFPSFQAIGVGVAADAAGNLYWVQDFGSVVFSPGTTPPTPPAPAPPSAPVTTPSPPPTTTTPPVTTTPPPVTTTPPVTSTPPTPVAGATQVGAALTQPASAPAKLARVRKTAVGKLEASKPHAGKPYSVRFPFGRVRVATANLAVHCSARLAGLPLTGNGNIAGHVATCTWVIPQGARGARLLVHVRVSGHRVALARRARLLVGR
jgi:uncharacterized protein YkwD